jgi:hypothetical protein
MTMITIRTEARTSSRLRGAPALLLTIALLAGG